MEIKKKARPTRRTIRTKKQHAPELFSESKEDSDDAEK